MRSDNLNRLDSVLAACSALDSRMDSFVERKADAGSSDESEAEYIKRTGSNSGYGQKYNAAAVEKGIASAYKGEKPPTGKQRSVTHALLRGRD